jgi:hypothetical protein
MNSSFVINELGWPRPVNPEDCVTNWRVNKWSCWRHEVNLSGYQELIPCTNDPNVPCCLTWYKICLDYLGREIITIENENGPTIDCHTLPGWNDCIKLCDE